VNSQKIKEPSSIEVSSTRGWEQFAQLFGRDLFFKISETYYLIANGIKYEPRH